MSSPDDVSSLAPALNQIGRYRLVRKLGQGGMGAVYEAVHTRLEKRVALKVLPQHLAGDKAAVSRFEREMRAVGRVDHPGIVRALDADEADGVLYIAMELVDGVDVAWLCDAYERKSGSPLPIGICCEVIRQGADLLQHVHDAGLIHRDLKPSNLMLTRDGRVMVLDLGLALLDETHVDGNPLTATGQVMGTVDYMAPEQAAETHDVDARADVYSLGATLYRMLSGRAPFPNERYSTIIGKLTALASVEPTPLQQLRVDCPQELVRIVGDALCKSPQRRIGSAIDLSAALRGFSSHTQLTHLARTLPVYQASGNPSGSSLETGQYHSTVEATATMLSPAGQQDPIENVAKSHVSPSASSGEGKQDAQQTMLQATSEAVVALEAVPTELTAWPIAAKRRSTWRTRRASSYLLIPLLALLTIPLLYRGDSDSNRSAPVQLESTPLPLTENDSKEVPTEGPSSVAQSDLQPDFPTGLFIPETGLFWVPVDETLIPADSDHTIELWVKPLHAIRPAGTQIMSTPTLGIHYAGDHGAEICGNLTAASKSTYETFPATLQAVRFSHLVIQTQAGRTAELFLDGKSTGILDLPSGEEPRGKPLNAVLLATNGTTFAGWFHQVRVSRGLRYRDSFTPSARLVADADTVALYRFDDTAARSVIDLSGHASPEDPLKLYDDLFITPTDSTPSQN